MPCATIARQQEASPSPAERHKTQTAMRSVRRVRLPSRFRGISCATHGFHLPAHVDPRMTVVDCCIAFGSQTRGNEGMAIARGSLEEMQGALERLFPSRKPVVRDDVRWYAKCSSDLAMNGEALSERRNGHADRAASVAERDAGTTWRPSPAAHLRRLWS